MDTEIKTPASDGPKWMSQAHISIATHGAPHHVDELVALAILRHWATEYRKTTRVEFLRRSEVSTRQHEFDVLLDIGEQHAPHLGRFDHHQGDSSSEKTCAAELVFLHLYRGQALVDWFRPLLRQITDWDNGGGYRQHDYLTLRGVIRSLGGRHHDDPRSWQCLHVVEALVAEWFAEAAKADRVEASLRSGIPFGAGILLRSDGHYGPTMQQRLSDSPYRFVGLPGDNRFQLISVRNTDGSDRYHFPQGLPEATFVHPNGFLAVFPTLESAKNAVVQLECTRRGESEHDPAGL